MLSRVKTCPNQVVGMKKELKTKKSITHSSRDVVCVMPSLLMDELRAIVFLSLCRFLNFFSPFPWLRRQQINDGTRKVSRRREKTDCDDQFSFLRFFFHFFNRMRNSFTFPHLSVCWLGDEPLTQTTVTYMKILPCLKPMSR